MKALSRRFTTMKPLMKPTSAPTTSTVRMPIAVGHSKPKPKLSAGRTTIAPIAGANAVDRLERQIELAGDDDERFREDDQRQRRRRGQDRVDVSRRQKNRTDDGADHDQHRQRRQQRQVAKPSKRHERLRVARGASLSGRRGSRMLWFTSQIPSTEATRSLSLQPASCSATTGHGASRAPGRRSADLRVRRSPPRIARPSRRVFSTTASSASFDFTSTPGCRIDEDQDRRAAGERPPHHHLLLVAAREVGNELLRPFGDDAKRVDGVRWPRRARRRGAMKPSGPSASRWSSSHCRRSIA